MTIVYDANGVKVEETATETVIRIAKANVPPPPPPVDPPPVPPPPVRPLIWVSRGELTAFPATGTAWDALPQLDASKADIQNQDSDHDTRTMGAALRSFRSGINLAPISNAIVSAIGTEKGGRTLALARNLPGYIIAADIINLAAVSPNNDAKFREWLRSLLTMNLDGKTLQSTHEERPNNWGTHAGAARAAIAVYLGDAKELARTAVVFHGWLGFRDIYKGFEYGDTSWQQDATKPVGINPKGSVKDGKNIDGVLPDDMRRGDKFPNAVGAGISYSWEALQGAIVCAEILHRQGYDVYQWQDKALLRAYKWLYENGHPADGDDKWQPWIVNKRYGTKFPVEHGGVGKNMAWTDWTHA